MAVHADPMMQRWAETSEINKAMLAELVQESRLTKSQPRRVIAEMGRYAGTTEKSSPFANMAQFLRAVKECPNGAFGNNPLMKQWAMGKALPSGMNETVGADGGVLVPPEFSQQIMMHTWSNDLLSRTTMIPLGSSNMVKIPVINETSRADGSRSGGVVAYWRSEAESATLSKPSLGTVTLTLDSLTAALRSTQELEDDAGPALSMLISTLIPRELVFKIGDALVNGDGVMKPEGIMNSPSKIAVAALPGQGDTILAENVLDMESRLLPECDANAVWLYDRSITRALGTMTVGTAGAQMATYLPPGGLSGLPYATLRGKPMLNIEFCQQLGTEGDLILTDLATVLTATKGGVQTAVSMHVYFLTNEQVYRFVMRLDGKSWIRSAITPKSGGPTLSNIVTLASR